MDKELKALEEKIDGLTRDRNNLSYPQRMMLNLVIHHFYQMELNWRKLKDEQKGS